MLTGSHLYKKLIPPIPSGIKSLIIIPAGRLAIIPFEALVSKDDDSGDYRNAPFLIKKYSVRYEFSAGLLLQKSKTKTNPSPSIFLCAPVTFPPSDHLINLPGTLKEVDSISDIFKEKHLTAAVYTGTKANETEIKSGDLKKYSLIHLATHGLVNESDPQLSCVYLQPDEPRDDGILYAGEIYNLQLNANLVTLSACKTGLGKITKGEGVIGLSRALIYAGARNILVSFWSVGDVSTARLMKDFYRNELNDPRAGFSENLRKGKLELLKSEKYSAPYYWAPFILIGY
jgi:CHAT domain-containing protein